MSYTVSSRPSSLPVSELYTKHPRWEGQYPFDNVCEKIVSILKERNWKIPDIEVKFRKIFGQETISEIKGKDFVLTFSNAKISSIIIPKRDINVFGDESGPALFTYVGNDWERDKESFMNTTFKSDGRVNLKPRTFLKYSGHCGPLEEGYSYSSRPSGKRNQYLVNNTVNDKEYKAVGDEPKYYHTEEVLNEFTTWLERNVLQKLHEKC